MEHLDEIRLMELALDEDLAPSEAEASHLETCPLCAGSLASEKHLTESLGEIAHRPVPDGFTERATQRFISVSRNRIAHRILVPVVLASVLLDTLTFSHSIG